MRSGANDKDTLFRAIGSVIVSFQRTERELTEALGVLLDLKSDEERRILSAAMSFGQKVDLFAALHRRDADPNKAELCRAACSYLHAAEEFRNDVVHSEYFVVSGKRAHRWAQQKSSIRGSKGLRNRKHLVNFTFLTEGSDIMLKLWFEATSFDFMQSYDPTLTEKLGTATEKLRRRQLARGKRT